MRSGSRIESGDAARRWYRQPIAWLALLVAAISLAGITATIVIASRARDEHLPVADERVLNVPVDRADGAAAPADRSAHHADTPHTDTSR